MKWKKPHSFHVSVVHEPSADPPFNVLSPITRQRHVNYCQRLRQHRVLNVKPPPRITELVAQSIIKCMVDVRGGDDDSAAFDNLDEYGDNNTYDESDSIDGGDNDEEYDDYIDEDEDVDNEYDEEDNWREELSKRQYDHGLVGPPRTKGDIGMKSRRSSSSKPMMVDDKNRHDQSSPRKPMLVKDKYRNDFRNSANGRSSSSSYKRKRSNSTRKRAQKLASKSIQLTTSLAWNAMIKQPGRLAYHIIRPKHVDLEETFGLWRLDQQITLKATTDGDDKIIASVATIELDPGLDTTNDPRKDRRNNNNQQRQGRRPVRFKPTVIVRMAQDDHPQQQKQQNPGEQTTLRVEEKVGEGQEEHQQHEQVTVSKTPYTFRQTSQFSGSIGSFKTQFVAPAFLTPDGQLRMYGYKGTWVRKVADRSVIKLVGKIYQVHKQRFGKSRGQYVFGKPVGTFVARRRMKMLDDEDDEEDYDEVDDDYDDDFEEEEKDFDDDGDDDEDAYDHNDENY